MSTVLLHETFESCQVGDSRITGWKALGGSWEVARDDSRNVVAQTHPIGDNMYLVSEESFSGDFRLSADIKMVGTNRWGCGLVCCYQNDGDLYQFEMWDVNAFLRFWVWSHYHYEAPGGIELPEPLKRDVWYTQTIERRGDLFTCRLEPGDLVFEARDSRYAGGPIALNAAGPIFFTNILMERLSGGA